MQTAKLFVNGSSQAVRLPKDFRFQGDEVGVKKVGNIVLLYPKDSDWENFCNCPPVTDEFAESVFEARRENKQSERAQL
ncbi:MAG: type II toxin-antitoxin system VapB family antitoxin [Oscillospiraceae bacterium]|nr:type II toxin-antitoxin system VapB family antitoxin [Oscillospiraceae bacterium]